MDLMEAYNQARQHDPRFGASVYEHEAAKTLPTQGRSFLLPKIEATGSTSQYSYDSAPQYYRDFRSESMSLSLQQPLFSLPRLHEFRQYKIREHIGDVKFVSAEKDLMLRTSEAYFNVLAAGDLLDLIDAEKKAIREQGEQARRMFQAGVATLTDVNDAQARFDSILAKGIEAKNNLDMKSTVFKRIVGSEPHSLHFLGEEAPFSLPGPGDIGGWIELAKQHNPVLKSYAYRIEFQEAELEKFKAQYWPTVDLVGGYGVTNTNDNIETDTISYGFVGVQFNLPIFSGGLTTAKVSESLALRAQARKEYENALAEITQELNEAFLGIKANLARIDALLEAKKSAHTSLISNQKSLIAGVRTTIDVLNAERELQNVRANLLKARYDCLSNIIKLRASAGTLSADDLRTINSWLQPAAAK
jgi:outer membrane protein